MRDVPSVRILTLAMVQNGLSDIGVFFSFLALQMLQMPYLHYLSNPRFGVHKKIFTDEPNGLSSREIACHCQ